MKRPTLFLIHCGFYEEEISHGIFEFHVNIPIVACDVDDAKRKVRADSVFTRKKMHIDGIQTIEHVNGFEIIPQENGSLAEPDKVTDIQYRDLCNHYVSRVLTGSGLAA